MIDRTAKIEIIQLKEIVIAKRNGIVVTVFYRECDFDIAKTIKKSIDEQLQIPTVYGNIVKVSDKLITTGEKKNRLYVLSYRSPS